MAMASVCWCTCTPELSGTCKPEPEPCCMAVGADTPPSCALAASLAPFRLEASMPAPATPLFPGDEVDCTLWELSKDVDGKLV